MCAAQIAFCNPGTAAKGWNVCGELKDQLRHRRRPGYTTKFIHNAKKAGELRRRAGAGEQKTGLAREFGISRETLYQYLRKDSPGQSQ